MNIPLSSMLYTIRNNCDIQYYNVSEVAQFSGIRVYSDTENLFKNSKYLIFISYKEFKEKILAQKEAELYQKVFFAICKETAFTTTQKKELEGYHCVSIVSRENETISLIMNKISDLIDFFSGWERQLHLSVLSGSSLNEIIDISTPLLDYPVIILNKAMTVISSFYRNINEDEVLADIIERGYVDKEFLDKLQSMKVLPQQMDKVPFFMGNYTLPNGENRYSLFYQIIEGNNTSCYFLVLGCTTDPRDGYSYYMDMLVEGLSIYFKQDKYTRKASEDNYEALFGNILDSKKINNGQLQASSSFYPKNLKNQVFLLSRVKFTTTKPSYSFIGWNIKNNFSNIIPFVYKGNLYLLKHFKQNASSLHYYIDNEEDLKKMYDAFRGNPWYMCVSNAFFSLEELPNAYDQCLITYDYSQTVVKKRLIYNYDSFALKDIVKKSTQQKDSLMMESPYYKVLREYDEQHKSDLCYVYAGYIISNFSITKASAYLFLHRNTVQNKIKKAEEIMNGKPRNYSDFVFFVMNFYRDNPFSLS